MHKRKYPSGASKRQLVNKRELQKAGSDSKQAKLQFFKVDDAVTTERVTHMIVQDINSGFGLTSNVNKDDTKTCVPGSSNDVCSVELSEERLCECDEDEEDTENALSDCEDDISDEDENKMQLTVTNISLFIPPDKNLPIDAKLSFLESHPVQPVDVELPFTTAKTYRRQSDNTERKWLSYNVLRLPVNKKHVYLRLKEHETSTHHTDAVHAYLCAVNKKDIESFISINQVNVHKKEVELRRSIITRIIDVILFLGRQGLPYRGKRGENIRSLSDRKVNHGNFLELLLLISEYDPIIKNHIANSILITQKQKQSRGRGSVVTFLSKNFINKIIQAIGLVIQQNTLEQIKKAKIFSVQLDSTQDIAIMEQLSICVRYVFEDKVLEKLIKLSVMSDTSGANLLNEIKTTLQLFDLSTEQIVACAFDGAANMQGPYIGLQALLKQENPQIISTHCMAHVLNLVLTDCTECCTSSENLFGLVETCAVFLSESYKRMQIWSRHVNNVHSAQDKLRKLQKIGVTRWWSKHAALCSIIDTQVPLKENQSENSRFLTFLLCMEEISTSRSFDSKTKFTDRTLIQQWSKFETILTATLHQRIFIFSTPVSKFLQRADVDYLAAYNMIKELTKQIQKLRCNPDEIFEAANLYTAQINHLLETQESEIVLESEEKKELLLKKKNDR